MTRSIEDDMKSLNYYLKSWKYRERESVEDFLELSEQVWTRLSLAQPMGLESLRAFRDKLDWEVLSNSGMLKAEHLEEFEDYVNWDNVIKTVIQIPEDIIRKHFSKISRPINIGFHKVSEDFVVEFKEEIDWEDYCSSVIDPWEPTLEKCSEYLHWENLCCNEDVALSEYFVFKYRDKMVYEEDNSESFYSRRKIFNQYDFLNACKD